MLQNGVLLYTRLEGSLYSPLGYMRFMTPHSQQRRASDSCRVSTIAYLRGKSNDQPKPGWIDARISALGRDPSTQRRSRLVAKARVTEPTNSCELPTVCKPRRGSQGLINEKTKGAEAHAATSAAADDPNVALTVPSRASSARPYPSHQASCESDPFSTCRSRWLVSRHISVR